MSNENHNIWALLVGINRYKSYGIAPLTGCVNDVTGMRAFLTGPLGVPVQQVKTLVNGEATRAAILRNFREFLIENPAIPHGSQLLFQFSGHGSQMPDPTGTEPDGLDETIVPYNSRTGQVFDIPDKTLAALIGRLAEEKGTHITVILDCCHSGSGTRMIAPGGKATTRRAPADFRNPPANLDAAFLKTLSRVSSGKNKGGAPGSGIKRTNTGPSPTGAEEGIAATGLPLLSRRSSRSGWALYHPDHVLLAGCLDREESNEYYPPGEEPHGALTWFSLQYLKSKPAGATYADWHAYVLQKIPALFSDQTPQCEGDVSRTIFGDAIVTSPAPSGVPERLLRKSSAPPRQQVILQPSGGESGLLFLEAVKARISGKAGTGKPSPFLELPGKPASAPALVVAMEEEGITIRDEKGRLLVSPGDNPSRDPARTVSALESIARYRIILHLSGEIPSRLQGKFSLRLLRCTTLSDEGITTAEEIPETPGETLTIPYFPEDKSSNLYAQEITNLSKTDVYPHLFILNPDFSIYRLYPVAGQQELLKAGQMVTSGMTGSGGAPLELYLPGDQPGEERCDESREVLKLMVTTSPCDLAMLEQDPLEVPPASGRRGTLVLSPLETLLSREVSGGSTRGKPARLPAGEELATAELAYRLVRHTPSAGLHGDAATVELGRGFSLDTPAGFTGRISLDTLEGTRRGLTPGEIVKLPPALTQGWLAPVTRSAARGLTQQPLLLTIHAGETSRRAVSPQNPLRLRLPAITSSTFLSTPPSGLPVDPLSGLPGQAHASGETISPGEFFPTGQAPFSGQLLSPREEDYLPVAFDGEDYLPVGYSVGPGLVDIVALPPPVSGGGDPTRCIGGALRLFLCRKLGRPEKNSGLRLAELVNGALRYRDPVPALFHSGDRVALFVHGFLSQSAGMTRQLVPLLEGMIPGYSRFLTW
ncbi:MAG TPA: caspase family protein, partial [Prolixibacteraceae bacterium]|nr:caspase family protein [Prolixibacteraceae bacterium]